MMWWSLWCAAVVVGSSAVAAPAPDNLDMVQIDSAPDDESLYAVQPMSRYASPWLYLLDIPHDSPVPVTAMETNEESAQKERLGPNRERRSFIVNAPVEHLQKITHLNYMRRVAEENRHILDRIGKRAMEWSRNLLK